MKNFKLSLFWGFNALVAMLISGCVFGGGTKVAIPESTMPQEMSVVFAIDHSNPEQVALFKQIISRVPSLGLWEEVVSQMDSSPSPFKYTENKELIESSWKLVLGVKLPADPEKLKQLMTGSNVNLGSGGIEIYVAGKFAMPDKVRFLLDEIVKADPDLIEFVGDEKNQVWRAKQGTGNVLIVRVEDVYFMATSTAQKDEILKRVEEGTGFDKNEYYQEKMKLGGDKDLGYLYLDMSLMNNVYKNLAEMGQDTIPIEALGMMKGLLAIFSVENDGFNFVSKISFGEDKALIEKYYPDYKVSLIDKIPAKGVIVYEEMPSLGLYLEGFFKAAATLLQSNSFGNPLDTGMAYDGLTTDELTTEGVDSENAPVNVKPVSRDKGYKSEPIIDNPEATVPVDEPIVEPVVEPTISVDSILASDDLYGATLEQVGAIAELTGEDLKKILDNSYAFVISDIGGYLPTVSFYLQVDKDSVDNARKLAGGVSTYMDLVIIGLNEELKANNLDEIIKKEVKMVEGATLQKVYVDWTAIPEARVSELSEQFGINVLTLKIELYYGVLNDGVFVVALYPDFIDVYGKEVLSESDYYKEMRARAGEAYGRSVAFFRMSPVLELVDRYFQLVKKAGIVSEEYDQDLMLNYELYTKIASSFDYIFVSDVKDSDGVRNSVSVKIKEVQLSPELLQKREALEIEKKNAQDAMMKMYQEVDGGLIQ